MRVDQSRQTDRQGAVQGQPGLNVLISYRHAQPRPPITDPDRSHLPLFQCNGQPLDLRLAQGRGKNERHIALLAQRLNLLSRPIYACFNRFDVVLCQFDNRQTGTFPEYPAV